MYYSFKGTLQALDNNVLIATSDNGVVYTTDDGTLCIETPNWVLKYKGGKWYANDIYLGEGASPSANLDNISIVNEELWGSILIDEELDSGSNLEKERE